MTGSVKAGMPANPEVPRLVIDLLREVRRHTSDKRPWTGYDPLDLDDSEERINRAAMFAKLHGWVRLGGKHSICLTSTGAKLLDQFDKPKRRKP
jgi:hypothetical protein